jgi:hypothetical protein
MEIDALLGRLWDSVGGLWLLALVGSFFVMICESARPKPGEGESKAAPQGLALWAGILSLVTPLLLLLHAVFNAPHIVLVALIVVGAAVIAAAVVGWIFAAAAPSVGRMLNKAAPFLALPVFGLAAYVTWQSLFGLVNMLVSAFVR